MPILIEPTLLGKTGRTLLSYLPYTGLISKPTSRPQGISAIVRVKNVVDWVETSILSIKDFADEIVVVDNGSTDGTLEILHKLVSEVTLNLRVYSCPDLNLAEVGNVGFALTRYSWILRWDADFIARTEGEFDIKNLKRYIFSLDPRRYYGVFLSFVELAGDLEHHRSVWTHRSEDYLHTCSPRLHWVINRARNGTVLERLKVPYYYKAIVTNGFYFFHVNVWPKKGLFERYLWMDWMKEQDFKKFPTLESYILYRKKKEGEENFRIAEENFFREYLSHLLPYKREKFGEYPSLLEKLRSKSRYKIIYESGKIVGRIE